jgi:hypothetical protein
MVTVKLKNIVGGNKLDNRRKVMRVLAKQFNAEKSPAMTENGNFLH